MFQSMLHAMDYRSVMFRRGRFGLLVCLLMISAGCGTAPPATPTINYAGSSQCVLSPNQPMPLTANVPGATEQMEYKWSATAGSFTTSEQTTPGASASGPTVTYIAPDDALPVRIRVDVTDAGGTVSSELACNVEATPTPVPTFTETSLPTDTPLPTFTPTPTVPIACNHPSVTGYVFPQLKDVEGQFTFYSDKLASEVFQCHGVYDRFGSEPLSVRIQYTAGVPAGYWGIATPKEKGYDAVTPGFTELCFSAYSDQADQAFYIKMKDKKGRERQAEPPVNIKESGNWVETCTPLAAFSDQGVDLSQIENINLGFSSSTGSAIIWVDDFDFR